MKLTSGRGGRQGKKLSIISNLGYFNAAIFIILESVTKLLFTLLGH